MRIGLYGLPCAGKSYILGAVRNLEVFAGSSLLNEVAPGFQNLTEQEKKEARKRLALELAGRDNFLIDGHYAFGPEVVFTEEDGRLYDAVLYLYVDPGILSERIADSARNRKYAKYDISKWQRFELESLRAYCHKNNKDFYVLDNPPEGCFSDIGMVLAFIDSIAAGFSCVGYARDAAEKIGAAGKLSLVDGDRTLILEDSSRVLGYETRLFDNNFYTGFQSWRHSLELADYLKTSGGSRISAEYMDLHQNGKVLGRIEGEAVILTAGNVEIWRQIAEKNRMRMFGGPQMCADTKFFITKFLQEKGATVTAFGDSMNDYYMLRQADRAYLAAKPDGTVSASLKGMDLEGMTIV